MKYTKPEDKAGIKLAISTFLASKGTTMNKVAKANGLKSNAVWQKLNKGNVSSEYVNSFVQLVDAKAKLISYSNSVFKIGRNEF